MTLCTPSTCLPSTVTCWWSFVRFEAERNAASRRTISHLIERALDQSGYMEHLLSLSWGERRLANVHKLLRMARRYERSEGRDLRGFLDHVAHQQGGLSGAEPDAPVADSESDAVKLMSIHAAKGLEFGTVCIADLGRAQNLGVPDLLVDGDRIGLRLARLDGSEATSTLDFEELCEERRRTQAEEEERILYVAMTRARERLLLSGAVDLERWPERKLGGPAISWLGPALVADLPKSVQTFQSRTQELEVRASDGTRVRVSCRLNTPTQPFGIQSFDGSAGVPSGNGRRTGLFSAGMSGDDVYLLRRGGQLSIGDIAPEDPPQDPKMLSYTALSELERCGYRYYLERVLGLAEKHAAVRAEERGKDGLEARVRGTVVHRLLESLDFTRGVSPSEKDVAEVARELGAPIGQRECDELAALLRTAIDTEFAARLTASREIRREYPFAFTLGLDEPLFTGVIDVLVRERDGGLLVVDYKSDRISGEDDLQAVVEGEYAIQRLVYALAVLCDGAPRVEVVHWFLQRPGEPIGSSYTASDKSKLEDRLGELARAARAGAFTVSKDPHRGLCLTCPGRSGLCSWSDSDTLRERVGA